MPHPALAAAGLVIASVLAGCSSTPPEPPGEASEPTGQATPASSPAPRAYTAFRMTRTARSQADLAKSGAALAGVMYNQSAPEQAFHTALATNKAGLAPANVVTEALDVEIPWQQGLQFSYRRDNDHILVINAPVTHDTANPVDIGVDASRAIFLSAFKSSVSSGVVSALGLNPSDVRTSRIVQGEGSYGQAPVERTSEYIFTVPRKVNGIEVYEAGVEVSVHRAGQIARAKVFGPTVISTVDAAGVEVADEAGYTFTASVTQADLDLRVKNEHPGADIQPIGVRYWLPPGGTAGVVEPAQMYFVAPKAIIEGQTIKARGSWVAYSLKDASLTPTVWPRPEKNPTGNGRKQ
jgi:hypothetical protein